MTTKIGFVHSMHSGGMETEKFFTSCDNEGVATNGGCNNVAQSPTS